MFNPKIIKNDAEYQAALDEIDSLMGSSMGSPEFEKLELLTHLVNTYEEKEYHIPDADPVSVIKHVMKSRNLSQADVAPYFGGRNRASEVLSGKRPLTLKMVRSLHNNLGIPAEALLREGDKLPENDHDSEKWPLKEIVGQLPGFKRFDILSQAEEIVHRLFAEANVNEKVLSAAFRAGSWGGREGDSYAKKAWLLVVAAKARKKLGNIPKFDLAELPPDFLSRVAQLSILPDGPAQAEAFLFRYGILFVYNPQFSKTYIDGAAFYIGQTPIVALSVRRDRLDTFFFNLLHELAHILERHVTEDSAPIVDENIQVLKDDDKELKAHKMAEDAIIPPDYVQHHPAFRKRPSFDNVADLSRRLGVHEALVAGRIQNEQQNFKLFSRKVGHGTVRKVFENKESIEDGVNYQA